MGRCFISDEWITEELLKNHLENGKKIAIVSPDLHKRDYKDFWNRLKNMKIINSKDLILCTDYPEEARGILVNNKIKAIIFDMDGVLIEAKDWHYEALNGALELFGMSISRYDHLVTYDGLPTKKKLEMLSLERGLPKGLHKFINDMKQQYTMEIVHAKCKPVFHHQYALSK